MALLLIICRIKFISKLFVDFAFKYMYRNLLNNKFTRLVWVELSLLSLLNALTCADNSVNSADSDEDYETLIDCIC